MLSDPTTITLAGVAKSLPRIQTNGSRSVYQTNDEALTLTVSHQVSGERVKTLFRIDQKSVVADPLSNVNDYETLNVWLNIDRPKFGFTSTQVNDLVVAIKAALDATTVGKLYGKES